MLNTERARIALLKLTAGVLPAEFDVAASLSDPVELPSLEILRAELPVTNPEIQRLEAELDRANLRIDQERASVLPSVNVLYSNFQDKQFTSNTAGLSVRIPLFTDSGAKLMRLFQMRPGYVKRLITVVTKLAGYWSLPGRPWKLLGAG